MPITKASEINEVDVIPTGLFIDRLIGVGGIPKKRMVEIVGDPGVGKSTLCLQIIAEAQKRGQKCLWVDSEGSFTPLYAEKLNVNTKELDVLQERSGELILNEIRNAIEDETYDLIVLDSVGGITTQAEMEKAVGEVVMAGQSRIISSFIRKISPMMPQKNVAFIVINHTRINFETGQPTPAGGRTLEFHKAVSIRLKKKSGVAIKAGENIIGYVVVGEVWKKNKLSGNVGMKVDANFLNNEGFSKAADLLQDALDAGVFTKQGNTFYFQGEKLGMISKVRELMKTDFSEKIKQVLS